jgi:hypothetical protein
VLLNRFRGFLTSVIDRARFGHDLLNACYSLGGYWTRLTDAEKKPHVMLAMNHGVAGDEKLLKGDVLAILAALQSRMECAELQKHMVIPVREIPLLLKPPNSNIFVFVS